jgi:proteasome accessory factor B
VSRKSERLVNLTIALLATKRLLTKTEIFDKVEGYDGDADARDRMFERDKDELRSIGITIEVGQIDAFFEDEVGYRITQSAYKLEMPELSPQELTLIALSQQLFAEHALGDSAQDALIKFKSSGVPVDESLLNATSLYKLTIPAAISEIIRAIAEKRHISFEYLSDDFTSHTRTIAPYHLTYKFNKWYFMGLDQQIQELRTFRLDRLSSQLTLSKKSDLFSIPHDAHVSFAQDDQKISVTLEVIDGFLPLWLKNVRSTTSRDEWSTYEVHLPLNEETVEKVLRCGTNVKVLAPQELRQRVIDALAETVARHG